MGAIDSVRGLRLSGRTATALRGQLNEEPALGTYERGSDGGRPPAALNPWAE